MEKKKPCRNPCKECPWIVKNKHNDSWPKYVEQMENIGQIQQKKHACHMITFDTWGYENAINENNVCVGSILTI
jgi:hypothetical protein